jgi:poly[(R)-3-hydroxyalkanoate] polymerase subunit PhaC
MEKESRDGPPWEAWHASFINETFANLRRLTAIPFLPDKLEHVRKGVTPREVVYEEDRLKVYRYLGEGQPRFKTPLCLVFALVNRPYIMDLKEGRSIIAHYVKAGFDTYLIDWGTPTRAQRFLTTDDYVNGYMLNVVKYLLERTGSKKVNLLGYCMGGTLSTMFTAIHQDLVKNLVLLATGIDYSTRESLLNLWTDPRYFDVDKFVDTVGNVPAEFLQSAFLLLKPVANLVEKHINFAENIHRDEFVDDYLHMETWLSDNIPVPGEVYREFAKYLFQQNLLVKNRMPLGRHIVDLRKITCPLLNLMASSDHLVPCSQTEPLNDLVSSTDKEKIIWPAGHIGLAVSSKAQKELWPRAVDWLIQRTD